MREREYEVGGTITWGLNVFEIDRTKLDKCPLVASGGAPASSTHSWARRRMASCFMRSLSRLGLDLGRLSGDDALTDVRIDCRSLLWKPLKTVQTVPLLFFPLV